MLAKCIGMTTVSFALALAVLTYARRAPETVASNQTEMVATASGESSANSNAASAPENVTNQLDEVINSAETTIEMLQAKRFAHDKDELVAKLKQVRTALDGKIENNRYPLMAPPLRQSKQLLGMTTQSLKQGKLTPAEAQEIAVITFESIIKQARRTREFQRAVVNTVSEKMKGHEQAFFDAALKGVKSLKD